jgi:hypothetical protein
MLHFYVKKKNIGFGARKRLLATWSIHKNLRSVLAKLPQNFRREIYNIDIYCNNLRNVKMHLLLEAIKTL